MSKRPKRDRIPELREMIGQLSDLADKAEDVMRDMDDEWPDEVWKQVESEVAESLTISCESTMDGRVLVEVTSSDENIIRKESFDFFEVFENSTFTSADKETREQMIATIKRVLDFAESHTASEDL